MMRPEDLGQCRGTQRGSVGTEGDQASARSEGVAFDVSLAAITPGGVKDLRRSSRGINCSEYSAYLCRFKRPDERTRTAFLLQLLSSAW
jgi:hypothetical protein